MVSKYIGISLVLLLVFISTDGMAEQISKAVEEKPEFQFATDPWPPFFLETPESNISAGIGYELVVELFKNITEAQPTFPKLPWKRALLEVEAGSKDAIALLLKTPERSEYMVFTKPIMQTPALMFFNKKSFPDGFQWQKVSDFDGHRVGIVRGYSYGEPLDSYIETKPKNVFVVTSSSQLFSMLQRQHIDLVPENSAVAYMLANEQGWSEHLGAADEILSTDILHIGISKKTKYLHLLNQLNDAIEEMRSSGKIDQLVGHIGSSVQP